MSELAAQNYNRSKIHPQKFLLWIGLASLVMMFAAFTSAYVVRQAAGNWLEFRIPNMFFYSTAVILASSLSLQASYAAFKKNNTGAYKKLLLLAFVLGLTFLVMQYLGWQDLVSIGVELTGNPSGSFLYIISGVHAVHVLGGVGVLFVALMHAYGLSHKVTEKRKLRFELTLTYWHFVDFLWLYLIVFFVLQAS